MEEKIYKVEKMMAKVSTSLTYEAKANITKLLMKAIVFASAL